LTVPGPLDGVRVLDCSHGMAGPRATGLFADYGADVVWVERPGGDPCRPLEPAAMSVYNRGKRSVELDLTDAAAREQLLHLADRADVFVESWAPGTAERLGVGYETLHARNQRLVYVSISGFGEDGRDATLPGYEPIVQAAIGSMSEQAGHRPGPIFNAFPFASLGAAYLAVIGALAALYRRDDDGVGRHVWTSLVDGAAVYNAMFWGETDESVAALAASGGAAAIPLAQTSTMRLLTRSFECADGEYLGIHTGAVGAFGRAMKVLGLDDRVPPSETGMDIGIPLTPEQVRIVNEEIPDIFRTRPRAEWVRLFMEADVCAVEHLRPTEVYDTPQAVHNEMVVEVDDPVLGPVRQVGVAAKLAASPGAVGGPAPRVGEHTESVLADLAGWPEPVATSPATPNRRPVLDGVKILDVGAYYAGPYSSRLLADLGADVVKVEPLLGDQLRGLERPFFSAQAKKRALAANLKDPALTRAAEALLRWADVVHHNLRPGAADRLGLGYESVRKVNPDIVYLHAPGWGSSGPFAMRQSFAPMLSGYVGVTYEVAGRFNPPMPPSANEDPGNGLLGAVGMLLALLHRNRTGEGQFVENPQLNAAMGHMAHIVRRGDGEVVGAGRLDPLQMGFGAFERLYETADGLVCVVAYDERDRRAAVDALGVARVGDDDAQADRVAEAVRDRNADDVVRTLTAVGVAAACAVGRNIHGFMNDPEQRRLGRVAEVPHPTKGNVRELHVLVRVSDSERTAHRLAPELGEHSDAILGELGYAPDDIAALRAAGAIR
jgi:crotonobetainyl-CoA:carnitine CoA-transferase CaiB-like acyl-CoA transferase